MGGKALLKNGVKTRRVDKYEYNSIRIEIEGYFTDLGWVNFVIPSYFDKPSFGDLDILLRNGTTLDDKLYQNIENHFKPKAIVSNANVLSFDYKNFQIDVIKIHPGDWNTSKTYFSYDPVGNVIGKIAHKFGLKYGHNGLIYPYRSEGGYVMGDIKISSQPHHIFDFLGYDFAIFNKGFKSLEDIFEYLINGTYFDPDIFQFGNLNAIDKKRNKKRPSYNQFLEYINNLKSVSNEINWQDKLMYIPEIDTFFKEARLIPKYFELMVREKTLKKIKSKFSGDIVMGVLPNMKGKELGKFIQDFKEKYPNFEDYVLSTEKEQIVKDIENYKFIHFNENLKK